MPRMFEDNQRVAVNGDPLRVGRIIGYSAHPTAYTVMLEGGEVLHDLRAGRLTAVEDADAPPEPLKVGDRVRRKQLPGMPPDFNRKPGVLIGIDEETGEAWVRLDTPYVWRSELHPRYGGPRPVEFKTACVRLLTSLEREPEPGVRLADVDFGAIVERVQKCNADPVKYLVTATMDGTGHRALVTEAGIFRHVDQDTRVKIIAERGQWKVTT